MIQFKSLRQYNQKVNGIRFPQKNSEPFMILYFSENSSLIDDYPKLGIRPVDNRIVVIPTTIIPRTRLDSDTRKLFRTYGLYAYNPQQKIPPGKNFFFDISNYLKMIDKTYKVTGYRQRAGFLLKDIIVRSFTNYLPKYQKILIYSVKATEELNTLMNRKIFPLLKMFKEGEQLTFDHMILSVVGESNTQHRLLIKDRQFQFPRIFQILKSIKITDTEEEIESDVDDATTYVMKNIDSKIIPDNKEPIKGAVKDFLSKSDNYFEKTVSKTITKDEIDKLVIASILHSTNGNVDKSIAMVSKIHPKNIDKALKTVDKVYGDQILEPQKTVSTTEDVIVQLYDIPKTVDNKSPEHIFQKRQVDFEKNLKNDFINSFKVLQTKDVPLKFKNLQIVDKEINRGDLTPSDIQTVIVTLLDTKNREHVVKIDIPKIDHKSGTFRVYGQKKCLINQIVLCPITFPNAYMSKFESSYSIFRLYSKRTKRLKYLELYLGSYKLPFSIVLFYSFGFESIMKEYGISYTITDEPIKKNEKFASKIGPNQYIRFTNVNTELKEEFVESFIYAKIGTFNVNEIFGSGDYFTKLIIKMTGRVNSTWLISSMLENIVDPVAKQILINKQLPSELREIMHYMATKVIEGTVQDRNDITNQRIRGSEAIVHLTQSQILAAYTDYKEKVLSGNENAEFKMSKTKTLSEFNQLEIVANMEYANPVEEMGTMTRLSPVGKKIGGIPDKRAIQNKARNVHSSYFGNIDPLDTPEGPNIGINQQLTVDAYITSARGLFLPKELSNKEGVGILSTTTCMTPFIENNDGARVIMLSAQQKQVVPLNNPEPPIIQSGYESVLTNVLSDSFIKRSPCPGKIELVTQDNIVIRCSTGKKEIIDITPTHLKSGSGKDTLSVFNSKVKKGQVVKSNMIVAEGSCISNGNISLGRTLCVAVMPYKGYNFEDSQVISSALVDNDKLTSLHGIIEEVYISEKDRLIYICDIGTVVEKGQPLLRKSIGEIEELLGVDDEDDAIELSGGHLIKKSPGGKVVDIEVYSNLDETKFPQLKQLIDRTKKRYGTTDTDKFSVSGKRIDGILVKFKIEQSLKIGLGDKLTNRFGAKGTIGLIEDEKNMPLTPWGDRVEMIVNPIGIVGRINIGQLFELYTGLISKKLAINVLELKNKEKILPLFRKVFTLLDGSEKQQISKRFLNNFEKMGPQKYKEFVEQVTKIKFVPIVIPPFKSPPYQNIQTVLKMLDLKTGYHLNIPEYRTKTIDAVPVGYMYINKLEHLSEEKAHARSTGRTAGKSMQPTAGKRQEGGQRFGEMDTYALISYDCKNLLAEFFGPLSDDHISKKEIISQIIQNGKAEYQQPKMSPAKDLLNAYMTGLVLTSR